MKGSLHFLIEKCCSKMVLKGSECLLIMEWGEWDLNKSACVYCIQLEIKNIKQKGIKYVHAHLSL